MPLCFTLHLYSCSIHVRIVPIMKEGEAMKSTASAVKTICDMPKSQVQKLTLQLTQNTFLHQLGLAKSAQRRLEVLRELRDMHPDIFSELLWLAEGKNLPSESEGTVPLKSNILCIVEACRRLDIPFKIDNQRGMVQSFCKAGEPPLHFKRSRVPFNAAVVTEICKDKDALSSVLKDVVQIPEGISYLDPEVETRYQPYRSHTSVDAIAKDAIELLGLPLIVKPNSGSEGTNVAKCSSQAEVENALARIYDKTSDHYDNLALIQKYIEIVDEYRAIAFDKKIILVYKKDVSEASVQDNYSPLHRDGAKARHITDKNLITKLERFTQPIYKMIPIEYCGYDIAQDLNGELWLIEANTLPMFTIFLEHNSSDIIVDMYERILRTLI